MLQLVLQRGPGDFDLNLVELLVFVCTNQMSYTLRVDRQPHLLILYPLPFAISEIAAKGPTAHLAFLLSYGEG